MKHELVYPGHPVHLAIEIMALYPSYSAANMQPEGQQFAPALSDIRISGAGGAVYSGLFVLKEAERCILDQEAAHVSPADIWQLATEIWNNARVSDFAENREKGNQQADALKDEFVETLTAWLVR